MNTQLKITRGRGIHLNFSNGVTLSVQIGAGNYCDNYDEPFDSTDPLPPSTRAEVAAWVSGGTLVDIGNDTVAGYVPIDKVLLLLPVLSGLPDGVTKEQLSETLTTILGEN